MLKYAVLMVSLILCGFRHPIHVSVCEIELDRSRQALEITQRIFIDDLEKEVRNNLKAPYLDITQPDNGISSDNILRQYLQQHFTIVVNGKQVDYTYLGHEFEGDVVYCYMEIQKVKKLRSIGVTSSILHELYEDQANLVHIEVDGSIRSMKLMPNKPYAVIAYN